MKEVQTAEPYSKIGWIFESHKIRRKVQRPVLTLPSKWRTYPAIFRTLGSKCSVTCVSNLRLGVKINPRYLYRCSIVKVCPPNVKRKPDVLWFISFFLVPKSKIICLVFVGLKSTPQSLDHSYIFSDVFPNPLSVHFGYHWKTKINHQRTNNLESFFGKWIWGCLPGSRLSKWAREWGRARFLIHPQGHKSKLHNNPCPYGLQIVYPLDLHYVQSHLKG